MRCTIDWSMGVNARVTNTQLKTIADFNCQIRTLNHISSLLFIPCEFFLNEQQTMKQLTFFSFRFNYSIWNINDILYYFGNLWAKFALQIICFLFDKIMFATSMITSKVEHFNYNLYKFSASSIVSGSFFE